MHRKLRSVYVSRLEQRLASGGARSLPGVMPLLAELERTSATLGLLTGNFEETGSMKLRAAGIDPGRFAVRVWGDESPHVPPRRAHLVPLGMERGGRMRGTAIEGESVVVIGDTPHDVECARANGCRCLGVATGHYSVDKLAEAGASVVMEDLSDTRRVLSWLGV
jgi:phosphoglycolate phosphatase-like HAD superfamily hydrolase